MVLKSEYFMYLFCLCRRVGFHGGPVEAEENLQELAVSFYQVQFKDRTLVIKLVVSTLTY